MTSNGATPPRRDLVLIGALRRAHAMVAMRSDGLPVLAVAPSSPYPRRLVLLAFLAPDLQRAIIEGRQPKGLTLRQLMRMDIPIAWEAQRSAIAG